jgi:hypothetical protein
MIQVLAIILGFAKNLHSRWRLRTYSTVEGRLLDSSPNMVEAQIKDRKDAPFGVRAIESGVEIEGVWISHPNTPVPSCPGSRLSSAAGSTSSSFLDEPTTPSFAVMEAASVRAESTQNTPSYYAPSKRTSDTDSTASWTIDTNGFKQVEVYRPRPLSTPAANRPSNLANSAISQISDSSSIDRTLKRSKLQIQRFLYSNTNRLSLNIIQRRRLQATFNFHCAHQS